MCPQGVRGIHTVVAGHHKPSSYNFILRVLICRYNIQGFIKC